VAELKSQGIEATDIPGGKGQFDVIRDGQTVFSKHDAGRFPEHDEIVALLA
jgi:predicted Rdx family selenoprotein